MKACQPKIWGKTEEKHDNVDDIDDDCDFEGADNEDHGDASQGWCRPRSQGEAYKQHLKTHSGEKLNKCDRDLKEKHTSDQSKRSRTAKPPRVYLQR